MIRTLSSIVWTSTLLLILVPQNIFAAELLFKTTNDPYVVEVRIDPQSKQMNVIEGKIEFSGDASNGLSVQIENGQSILPIWPTPPQYDDNNKDILFVGGIPNGFNSEGLLFKLRLSPKVSGNLTISYVDGGGYLNDGKGTRESVSSESFEMNLNKNLTNDFDNNSFNFNKFKGAIIILLLVTFVVFFKYGFRKKIK